MVIAPPSEAEVDVYITVDVFGTVYTRVDWFLANNEILKAKASMEVFAVDTVSGEVLMPPQSAGAESEYNEQYILWAGPIKIRKSVNKAEPLLADFSDAAPNQKRKLSAEKQEPVPWVYGLWNTPSRKALLGGRWRAGSFLACAYMITPVFLVAQCRKPLQEAGLRAFSVVPGSHSGVN